MSSMSSSCAAIKRQGNNAMTRGGSGSAYVIDYLVRRFFFERFSVTLAGGLASGSAFRARLLLSLLGLATTSTLLSPCSSLGSLFASDSPCVLAGAATAVEEVTAEGYWYSARARATWLSPASGPLK